MSSFILATAVLILVVLAWYFWPQIRTFIYGEFHEPVETPADPAPKVIKKTKRKPIAKAAKKRVKKVKARRR